MHSSVFTMMHSGKMVNRTLSLQLKRSFQLESKKKLTKETKIEMVTAGIFGLLSGSIFLVVVKDCIDDYHRKRYEALCREHYTFPCHRQ